VTSSTLHHITIILQDVGGAIVQLDKSLILWGGHPCPPSGIKDFANGRAGSPSHNEDEPSHNEDEPSHNKYESTIKINHQNMKVSYLTKNGTKKQQIR
jgi:hypothetical protein